MGPNRQRPEKKTRRMRSRRKGKGKELAVQSTRDSVITQLEFSPRCCPNGMDVSYLISCKPKDQEMKGTRAAHCPSNLQVVLMSGLSLVLHIKGTSHRKHSSNVGVVPSYDAGDERRQ
jgi:hypothetical protein